MDQAKTDQLRKIRDAVVAFKDSPLYPERIRNRVYPVIGDGNHEAKLMFVGEAPGKNEAETGRPFCGAAGKVLDELLASIDLPRQSVYVTNIVKDRPPGNRDPFPDEIEAYAPFLDRQIDIIQPNAIATLGRFSMGYLMPKLGLLGQLGPISRIHGQTFEGTASYGKVTFVPLFHPAMALYKPDIKEQMLRDFQVLKEFI
jgi:DNA polymerase